MVYDQFQHTVYYDTFCTFVHWHYVDICFASKLINVKQLLSSTFQILFINVLYFTHNFISSFFCRLDALRAGILQQRSIFLKLVYSIGEELMLTWTVVFIFLWFPGLPFSSSFYRVYSWDMYLHLVHFTFFYYPNHFLHCLNPTIIDPLIVDRLACARITCNSTFPLFLCKLSYVSEI